MFAGLVEHAFCSEVGLCDPRLTDYMADLLVSFTHIDTLNALRDAGGRKLEQAATILALTLNEKPEGRVERDRFLHRHIGDFALFWSGVYPEHLRRVVRDPSDVLLDYVAQGKRSYAIVSELAGDDADPPGSLFQQLSEDFETCVYGLGMVRRSWEASAKGPDRRELLL